MAGCLPVSPGEAVTPVFPARPAPNFAFSFAYGSCFTSTLDTFEQTYTTAVKDGERATVPVSLSDAQMQEIYNKIVAIDFFSYPETFRITYAEDEVVGMVTPAQEYRITVRNGDQTHSVFWIDEITSPTSREADQLRELIQMMMEVIESNPDIQNLPDLNFGCA